MCPIRRQMMVQGPKKQQEGPVRSARWPFLYRCSDVVPITISVHSFERSTCSSANAYSLLPVPLGDSTCPYGVQLCTRTTSPPSSTNWRTEP